MNHLPKLTTAIFVTALLFAATVAAAGGTHSGGHGPDIGQKSTDPADRVIDIEMGDMYFKPGDLDIKAGETVTFRITNAGEAVHEFNIGTAEMHAEHQAEMMKMMDIGALEADRINHDMMNMEQMAHNDPNSVLLEPGESAEMTWTFDGDARLEMSCNVPGHRESGMMGPIHMGDGHS